MKHFWSDRKRRDWIEDLRDISARIGDVGTNLSDSDRIRDSRTLKWIADSLTSETGDESSWC
jgi:hypothetical protein